MTSVVSEDMSKRQAVRQQRCHSTPSEGPSGGLRALMKGAILSLLKGPVMMAVRHVMEYYAVPLMQGSH